MDSKLKMYFASILTVMKLKIKIKKAKLSGYHLRIPSTLRVLHPPDSTLQPLSPGFLLIITGSVSLLLGPLHYWHQSFIPTLVNIIPA
jgi:hypothetical protein